jgi:hypothetical protein
VNLYAYAGSDPIAFSDPYGLWDPDWLRTAANFAAGFGDVLSLGLTYYVREAIDANDVIDPNSGSYVAGAVSAVAFEIAAGAAVAAGAGASANAGRASSGAGPKPGSAGGPGAGRDFSPRVQEAARAESGSRCVFCGRPTVRSRAPTPNRSNIDHSIPKSRAGNNTLPNAQNTCQSCNLTKGTKTTEEYLRGQH